MQKESDFPLTAFVSVTERCPLSCPHCYVERAPDVAELSLAELGSLFDQLADAGVLKLTITGGEPALRGDLEEIVSSAWRRRFHITLKTSAAGMTVARLERLRENGLAVLHVSLYHAEPDAHDAFVGSAGAWRNAVACAERFSSLGGIVVVGSVVMEWNAEVLPRLVALARERGWSFVADAKVSHRQGGGAEPVELRAGVDALVQAWRGMGETVRPGPGPSADVTLCQVGRSLVYVTSWGEVWPCPSVPVPMGNVRRSDFRSIWRESEVREELTRLTWGRTEECLACRYGPFCSRCPGESLLEHGDCARPASVDCLVARARFAAHDRDPGEG